MAVKLSTSDLLRLDAVGLQTKLDAGQLSSVDLVQACLTQIDRHDQRGAKLNAMISITPRHLLTERAVQLDSERMAGHVRSPFHGIPILIKDAIATAPSHGLPTTLGSLALKTSYISRSARIVEKLEAMGAIVLGKTNLNELCNFKGDANSNGWSAVGGQTQSAYLSLKVNETGLGQTDPCGSSTGSAVGVSAGYAPLALGTESIGSIVMPASRASLFALKPTLKTVDMDGVFKSSVDLDVVGGLAKSTADLALLSQMALTEEKRSLLPQEGYSKFLTRTFDSLRIGFLDPVKWSLHPDFVPLGKDILKQMNDIYDSVVKGVRNHAGHSSVAYPVDIRPAKDLWYDGKNPIDIVMGYEGKEAVQSWLSHANVPGLLTIEDLIEFNKEHERDELPASHPDQNQLLRASQDRPSQVTYEAVKRHMSTVAKDEGIDELFRERDLNILAFPMDSLMVFISAASGYPIATMPAGIIPADGRPYGVGIMAQAGREDLLFQFMSAFEAYFPPRALPSRVMESTSR